MINTQNIQLIKGNTKYFPTLTKPMKVVRKEKKEKSPVRLQCQANILA